MGRFSMPCQLLPLDISVSTRALIGQINEPYFTDTKYKSLCKFVISPLYLNPEIKYISY